MAGYRVERFKQLGIVLLLVFSTPLFASVTVAATTLRVPSDQPTIQAGIDAAANGDTVLYSAS